MRIVHFVEQLLADGVERHASAGARRLGDGRRAVGAHLGDRIADVQQIRDVLPLARGAEVAARALARAFQQVTDSKPKREAVPVVPAPAQLMHDRSERQRRVRYAPRQHDVRTLAERIRDWPCTEIGAGEQQPFAHACDRRVGVHVRKRFACRHELVETLEHRVPAHRGNRRVPAARPQRRRQRFARRVRIQSAGVEHELDPARRRERPQVAEHRHQIAGVAGGRILLPVLLQDGERELRQVVGSDVLDAAALDRGAHRPPRVSVEAQAGTDADGFHATTKLSPQRTRRTRRKNRPDSGSTGRPYRFLCVQAGPGRDADRHACLTPTARWTSSGILIYSASVCVTRGSSMSLERALGEPNARSFDVLPRAADRRSALRHLKNLHASSLTLRFILSLECNGGHGVARFESSPDADSSAIAW